MRIYYGGELELHKDFITAEINNFTTLVCHCKLVKRGNSKRLNQIINGKTHACGLGVHKCLRIKIPQHLGPGSQGKQH